MLWNTRRRNPLQPFGLVCILYFLRNYWLLSQENVAAVNKIADLERKIRYYLIAVFNPVFLQVTKVNGPIAEVLIAY